MADSFVLTPALKLVTQVVGPPLGAAWPGQAPALQRAFRGLWVPGSRRAHRVLFHHRISTAPQVTPAPKAAIRIMLPRFRRPARAHSSRQIGMEAEEVLPMRSMLL